MKFRSCLSAFTMSLVAFGMLEGGVLSRGQQAAQSGAPTPPARPKPSNIKALPKDISGADVSKLMHQYREQVGVPCEYCHSTNTQTGKLDFASDENPVKETARFMIRMTDDINTKYLAQLGDRRYSPPFNCGTCHQGQPEPPEFKPAPRQTQPH